MSGDGQWVTGLGFGNPSRAYRYNTITNTTEDLPNLDSGTGQAMSGSGITDDGATIVGGTWGPGPATFGTALIWREGIGTIRFDDYLDEVGVVYPDGFNFALASAISSDGNWIAGWAGPGSGAASWVVNIPEPGSAILTLLGLIAAAAFRRCN